MATTTPVYGWSVPDLNDTPNGPQQISNLGDAIDATVNGTTVIGVPGTASVSIGPTAWTTICSVSFTLPVAQNVEIVGWAFLVNTGSGRPVMTLQVTDGSTHLFGIGGTQLAGTSDNFSLQETFLVPRRRIGLTAGAHTLNLQVWKDSNGNVDAWKTRTFGSQDIAVTGIEASY